ncbi:DUF262 domain-containing protein, partial [Halomonas sp. AOP7-C1-8]
LEAQIQEEKKTVDFDTREFTIEIIAQKYLKDIDSDENELFVPDYQREFVWDDVRQSRLIESVTLGLPIPIIFVAENSSGRLEIVDGSQRIRTLAAFVSNELKLCGLEKLMEMNGVQFDDLPMSRRRKVNNTPIRMIVLSESATEQVKNDLFERINRGSDLLRAMEKRKGIYRGPFNDFIYGECAKNPLMKKLAPLAKAVDNRQEHEELILRFFALVDTYPRFLTHGRGIGSMLDEYMENMNRDFSVQERNKKEVQFKRMLEFVESSFPNGFLKRNGQGVSRVFFEALAVGVHFALEEYPQLSGIRVNPGKWMADSNFRPLVAGKFKTHTPDKIRARVDFVKNQLLANRS